MGLLTEEKNNYTFASSGFDAFMEDFEIPKQEQNIDESDLPDFSENEEIPEESQPQSLQMKTSVARANAKMITTVVDSVIPSTLSFIAKSEVSEFKADENSRNDLEDAMTEYMKLVGADIPPGIMVLLLVLTIYGSKIPFAIQQRKINIEREKLDKERKEFEKHKAEIELSKEQLKNATDSEIDHNFRN